MDLWSQMSFINPGLLGSLNTYKKKFQSGVDKDAFKELSFKIKPFMLRRNKKQVAKDLPEKIESIV
ncbi:SNF2-related protein, partial [Lactobacillus acetotolerans]|uniref:SNF2-related protein n=1 Tax=Lactobacillus acetotolerans TaxID=1600 RepID=UPI002FD97A35